jgi:cytochrome c peroxidase
MPICGFSNEKKINIYSMKYFPVHSLFVVLTCTLVLGFTAYRLPGEPNNYNLQVEELYQKQLSSFKSSVLLLQKEGNASSPKKALQQQFYQCRIFYKRASVLLDYFNQRESLLLNGPNLPRTESEIADKIIEPTGMQVIEDILFGDKPLQYDALIAQTNCMLQSIERIEQEPDRKYKFKDEQVFYAIQLAIVRMISLGITGFDSPTALNSLTEAKESMDGIQSVLNIYQSAIQINNKQLNEELINKAAACKQYLTSQTSFNQFNRLAFIKNYLNPFSRLLLSAAQIIGTNQLQGKRPYNNKAATIFDADAFNIHFFSPPEPYTISAEKIELGKKLFYDPILSGSGNRSCGSCHQPQKAFTDGLSTALAIDNKTKLNRNTPTLWNSALQTRQFWDSRTDILENQLDEVVHNETEMKGSLKQSVEKLKANETYLQLFKQAYQTEKNPVVEFTVANAICSYIRSLTALNSRFDQYMRDDEKALTQIEQRGFNLFAGKAKCATCHFIPLFNGLVPPTFSETESEVLGVPKTNNKKKPVLDEDLGKASFTHSAIHGYSFKTPTLRNIALTAPYMHNGVFTTLQEVMEFYNNGGGYGLGIAPANQTLPAQKLNLSKKEMKQIIAFMKALTDTAYHQK